MKVLDLFSGIGGFSLGLERAGMETVAFCEQDKFCQKVLKKHWPDIPIFDDVRTLDGTQFRGTVDVVCGGFPCQPFSTAGNQQGKNDSRHLWPEMFRVIRECQPTWVIGENVSGFVNMALDDCWTDLEAEGYEVQPFIIPACGVEAHHRRERCWIIAYSGEFRRGSGSGNIGSRSLQEHERSSKENQPPRHGREFRSSETGGIDRPDNDEVMASSNAMRKPQQKRSECNIGGRTGDSYQTMENADSLRQQGQRQYAGPVNKAEDCNRETDWTNGSGKGTQADRLTESGLGGEFDGLPDWMDGFEYIGNPDRFGTPRITTRTDGRQQRLKQLGNSVVPQIPEIIGRAIMNIEATSGR